MLLWLLQNAMVSAVLAAAVALACRWGAWGKPLGPALRHALWVVVLVKLMLPTVGAWPWAVRDGVAAGVVDVRHAGTFGLLRSLWDGEEVRGTGGGMGDSPAAAGLSTGTTANSATGTSGVAGQPAARDAEMGGTTISRTAYWTRPRVLGAGVALWLIGSVIFALVQIVRIGRMVSLVRRAARGNISLQNQVDPVAKQMAVRSIRAYQVVGIGSPYIWSLFRPVLLWPAEIGADDASRGLIVHELAHVKRRDHWVGWLELLAGAVWWWNPIYWLARMQLRENAELACDAWVVQMLPAHRRQYAASLLDACERVAGKAVPLPALGVGSGGKRVLAKRLISIMQDSAAVRLSWKHAAAVLAVAFAALPGWSQQVAKLPFTISKETTDISSPLLADGTPDYVTALNERYGKDVTPENNAFVLWVELAGTRKEDGSFFELSVPKVLALTGSKATTADDHIWMMYDDFFTKKTGIPTGTNRPSSVPDPDDILANARREMWSATDHPEVADYLKAQEDLLEKVSRMAARSKWWNPVVAADSHLSTGMLPSVNRTLEMVRATAARATLRAAAGDFDGFLHDVVTIKRFAALTSTGYDLFDVIVGYANSRAADEAIATVAASGRMTEVQCARLRAALDSLPPLRAPFDVVNVSERWSDLDSILLCALDPGKMPVSFRAMTGGNIDTDPLKYFTEFDAPAVDWDVTLKLCNQLYNDTVASNVAPSIVERKRLGEQIEKRTKPWKAELENDPSMRRMPGETRDHYSLRVAHAVMGVMYPNESGLGDRFAETLQSAGMASVLIEAAAVKARTGNWPQTAADLRGGAASLPRDMYDSDGREPIHYVLTANGPRVYSIGRNMKDDGGVRGEMDKDDIALPLSPPPRVPTIP